MREHSRLELERKLRRYETEPGQLGKVLDELQTNLREVVAMLLEDGEPKLEGEFVGTQTIGVA